MGSSFAHKVTPLKKENTNGTIYPVNRGLGKINKSRRPSVISYLNRKKVSWRGCPAFLFVGIRRAGVDKVSEKLDCFVHLRKKNYKTSAQNAHICFPSPPEAVYKVLCLPLISVPKMLQLSECKESRGKTNLQSREVVTSLCSPEWIKLGRLQSQDIAARVLAALNFRRSLRKPGHCSNIDLNFTSTIKTKQNAVLESKTPPLWSQVWFKELIATLCILRFFAFNPLHLNLQGIWIMIIHLDQIRKPLR